MLHSIQRVSALTLTLVSLTLAWSAAMAADVHFSAADGNLVYASLGKSAASADGVVLLFHQAGANRHEYDAVVPRLNRLGFDTLAVDQRSGGERFGHDNETVTRRGASASYLDAYPDLLGALDWAEARGYDRIIAVGSSYSASLTIVLAARTDDALTAAAVFSPGEYFDDPDLIKQAAAQVSVPLYITTDPKEEPHVDEVLSEVENGTVTRYKPSHGVHGASTLDPNRDPAGYRANWNSFSTFVRLFAPHAG